MTRSKMVLFETAAYLSPFTIVEHDSNINIQLSDVVSVPAMILGAEYPVPQENHQGAALSLRNCLTIIIQVVSSTAICNLTMEAKSSPSWS